MLNSNKLFLKVSLLLNLLRSYVYTVIRYKPTGRCLRSVYLTCTFAAIAAFMMNVTKFWVFPEVHGVFQ